MSGCWGMAVSGLTMQWRLPPTPARQATPGPGFWGAQIRGILGQALFAQACPFAKARCPSCALAAHCHYVNVFKPQDPNALPAYILHDGWLCGQTLVVTVLLLGNASASAETWIRGLHQQLPGLRWLGRTGMRLEQVMDWRSGRRLFERGRFTQERLTFGGAWPAPPGPQAQIQFLTPLASKHQQQDDPLLGALKTRLQRLRNQFGDGHGLGVGGPLWQCQTVMRRAVSLTLGAQRRRIDACYYTLQLSQIDPLGGQLLGAGLWLHAGAQTGIGLGRYCIA